MTKKYYIIYETRNLKNNKIYVGQHITEDLNDGYLGSGTRIKRAIRYYGKEFFKRKILYYCSSIEELNEKEKDIVNKSFLKRDDVYNLSLGGGNFDTTGQVTVKDKDSNTFNVRKNDPRYLSGELVGTFKGKKHSKETIEKMKQSHKGKQKGNKNSQYGTCWIRNEELNENKKIPKSDLEEWLSKGWIKGRKIKKKLLISETNSYICIEQ